MILTVFNGAERAAAARLSVTIADVIFMVKMTGKERRENGVRALGASRTAHLRDI